MSTIIEKEQVLNFYSPTEGLIQVYGTGVVKLFGDDGTMRTETNGYVMPADSFEITWEDFEKCFESWRTAFRHPDEDFSGVSQLIIEKTTKKKDVPRNEECGSFGRFTGCRGRLIY